MRKNKMMRTAAVLGVAAMLTASVLSGTFAKYTTTGTGTDTARVAKFGVTITANGSTFANTYTTDDTSVSGTIANSVVSAGITTEAAGDKVVAPGTSGKMAEMTLSGTPEVAVKVSYAGKFKLSDNWTADDNAFYCPLVIKVKNAEGKTTEIKQTSTNNTSKTDFEKAVNDAIAAYSKEYAANTDLSSDAVKGDSLTVSWEWPFEKDTANNTESSNDSVQTDAKDTALGDAAAKAKNENDKVTVTLAVTTTVTQID